MHRWAVIALAILLFAAPAFGLTNYYVDPTYTGGGSVGSAAAPWTSLDAGAWTAINAALATGPVTVYHSARIVASDTEEAAADYLNLTGKRTDASANRLKLDGYSFYNTNDSAGSWSAYTGVCKFKYSGDHYGLAQFDTGMSKQNNITIEGFHFKWNAASGSRFGVYWWGGDNVWFLHNTIGGGLYVEYAHYEGGRVCAGTCTGYILHGNSIANPLGEGIYFGGGGNQLLGGHDDILIEENIVHNCGSTEGQGDGIDVKDNNSHVVVSGNTCYSNGIAGNTGHGITSMSPGTYSGNLCYANTAAGIYLDSYWGPAWTDDVTFQNNICRENGAHGIKINASNAAMTGDIYFYNNSLYGNGTGGSYINGIAVSGLASPKIPLCTLKNNISYLTYAGAGYECIISNVTTITEDYNDFCGNISGFTRAAHSLNTNPLFVSTTDLQLQAASPCLNTGTTVASVTTDYAGIARPQGPAYDMGAYEKKPLVSGITLGGTGSITRMPGATGVITFSP